MKSSEAATGESRSTRRFGDDRGAVGTEMAIVVAIVVGIALALGAVMISSAQSHQACIPATAGASPGPGCP
jgi:hypothetical protein